MSGYGGSAGEGERDPEITSFCCNSLTSAQIQLESTVSVQATMRDWTPQDKDPADICLWQ